MLVSGDAQANAQFFLQFITRYLHWTGELRCRVTTVTRRWIDGSQIGEVITGERFQDAVRWEKVYCQTLRMEH